MHSWSSLSLWYQSVRGEFVQKSFDSGNNGLTVTLSGYIYILGSSSYDNFALNMG